MIRKLIRFGFEKTEVLFSWAFPDNNNPLLQLGAMGWFFYWIVVVSGIYLYIFYDTGVTQAYQSVEYLTHQQWYIGGVMRSLHRYASDALVVVVVLHMLREYGMGRLYGPRYFTWITGVALIWFIYASGITGYWIVWDMLAQYVAISASELLDSLPFFGEPIAANFLMDSTLSGRFFTLFVFIHIAVPLFMLFLMWFHILRISNPLVNPPKYLALGTLSSLVLLSLISPATSQGPARLEVVPAELAVDWYYLMIFPLSDHYPGIVIWLVLFSGTLILMLLPWFRSRSNSKVAVVDLPNCNSCGRCIVDCPYAAVSLRPRTDGMPYTHQAVVDTELCTSCGICAGACPTATPFRNQSTLVPGIQLPDFSINKLKEQVLETCNNLNGNNRVLVFACDRQTDIAALKNNSSGLIKLPCIGMLPPSFIDFCISRRLADGVFLAGCSKGACFNRFGNSLTEQRINRDRDPKLRKRINRGRICMSWKSHEKPGRQLHRFSQSLTTIPADENSTKKAEPVS